MARHNLCRISNKIGKMGIFKIILIAAAVYYLIKIILRLTAPYLLRKMFEKMNGNSPFNQTNNMNTDGEMIINKDKKRTHTDNYGGEYVEFEEIND